MNLFTRAASRPAPDPALARPGDDRARSLHRVPEPALVRRTPPVTVLDSANDPRMRFVSTAVRLASSDVYLMTGDLTIKNTTRPVDLEPIAAIRTNPDD